MRVDGSISPKNQFWGDPVVDPSRRTTICRTSDSSTSIMNRRGDEHIKGPPCKGLCPKNGWTIDQFCAHCHDS